MDLFLKELKDNEYEISISYIEKIKNNVDEKSIDKILNEFIQKFMLS